MKSRVGHMNVCAWCGRLIRGAQHMSDADTYACDMFVTVRSKRGVDVLVTLGTHGINDFAEWERVS